MQKLHQLSERLFYLSPVQITDRPILVAVVGDHQTLLIDAGNSSAHAKLFKEKLAEQDIVGDIVVLSHWHWDHVFGLSEMNLPSIANSVTFEKIKELQGYSWEDEELDERVKAGIEIQFCADAIKLELENDRNVNIPDPTIIFDKHLNINLGGITCTIEQIVADHSVDSTLIYIQEEKALFLADSLYANMYAEKWHYTYEKMSQLLEKIESYDAEIYFLSHHPAPLTKDEFRSFTSLLKTCAKFTKKHKGIQKAIVQEMTEQFGRELNEDELEIIEYFVNGY